MGAILERIPLSSPFHDGAKWFRALLLKLQTKTPFFDQLNQ